MLFSDWLESLETLCSAFSLASKPVQAIKYRNSRTSRLEVRKRSNPCYNHVKTVSEMTSLSSD